MPTTSTQQLRQRESSGRGSDFHSRSQRQTPGINTGNVKTKLPVDSYLVRGLGADPDVTTLTTNNENNDTFTSTLSTLANSDLCPANDIGNKRQPECAYALQAKS